LLDSAEASCIVTAVAVGCICGDSVGAGWRIVAVVGAQVLRGPVGSDSLEMTAVAISCVVGCASAPLKVNSFTLFVGRIFVYVVGAVCPDAGSAVVRASAGSGGAVFSVAANVVVRASVKSGGTAFEVACLFSDSMSDGLGCTAVAESVDGDAGSSVDPGVSRALAEGVLLSRSDSLTLSVNATRWSKPFP
jgi:hypothetical protein